MAKKLPTLLPDNSKYQMLYFGCGFILLKYILFLK